MRFFLLTVFVLSIAIPAAAFAQSDAVFSTRSGGTSSLDEYADIPKGMLLTREERAELQEKEKETAATAAKDSPPKEENASAPAEPANSEAEDAAALSLVPYEDILRLYRAGNFSQVIKDLKPLAEGGHHGAEELLGVMYRMGQGVEKSPEIALSYLEKAAEQSRPLAQHHLGIMHYQGEGVDPDSAQALMWLTLAVIYYPDGAEKDQARQDKESVSSRMTRREKDNAFIMARDWLKERGEAHLLEQP